jgi:hypothetical protein
MSQSALNVHSSSLDLNGLAVLGKVQAHRLAWQADRGSASGDSALYSPLLVRQLSTAAENIGYNHRRNCGECPAISMNL